jgi:hypothetical protein
MTANSVYHRYHIEIEMTPDLVAHPRKFQVKVKKHRLLLHGLKGLIAYRGNWKLTMSRPCMYDVYSRPIGGLAPIEDLCVGCLRCTTEHPEVVQIHPNPERERLGDSYLKPDDVDTIMYEARTGRVPVRGAGYRGLFGGEGWDGMWTDMSEIVRPTRDGIHGREFISTSVDIGAKPAFLRFDAAGQPTAPLPGVIPLQVPFLFDAPPATAAPEKLLPILVEVARQVETMAIVPVEQAVRLSLGGPHVAPLVAQEDREWLERLSWQPQMVMLEGWDRDSYEELRRQCPDSLVCVRAPMDADVLELAQRGVRVFHLAANYHGEVGGRFAMDLIQQAHRRLVEASLREEVTLIGSGGIVMAEHVPKAIICGLDAVALDTALWVALQALFEGECLSRETARLSFPRLETAWAIQRLKNLAASWRDQLLEILGAMGLREVRRMRGELGRCMFQHDLEREAFGDIEGFADEQER